MLVLLQGLPIVLMCWERSKSRPSNGFRPHIDSQSSVVFLTGTVGSPIVNAEHESLELSPRFVLEGEPIQTYEVLQQEMAVPTIVTRRRGSTTNHRANTKRGDVSLPIPEDAFGLRNSKSTESHPPISSASATKEEQITGPATRSRTQVPNTKPMGYAEGFRAMAIPETPTSSEAQASKLLRESFHDVANFPIAAVTTETMATTDGSYPICGLHGDEVGLSDINTKDEPIIDFTDGMQGSGRPIVPGNNVTVRFKAKVGTLKGAVFQQCGKDAPVCLLYSHDKSHF